MMTEEVITELFNNLLVAKLAMDRATGLLINRELNMPHFPRIFFELGYRSGQLGKLIQELERELRPTAQSRG